MGASIVQTFVDPPVDDLTEYQESTKKSLEVIQGKFWDIFITTVLAPHRQVKELGFSLIFMRRLVEANRAMIQDPTVSRYLHVFVNIDFRFSARHTRMHSMRC